MSNLLAIETAFLRLPEVAAGLQLSEVRSIQRVIETAQKKKFSQSLALSQHVNKAVEWFRSDAGKAKLSEEGITWTIEQFSLKAFGWQKSYLYKLLRTAVVPAEVVEQYQNRDTEERSIEGLLSFAKELENNADGGGQGEDGEESESSARSENIFSLTFKHPDFKVNLKINEAGQIRCNNTTSQIFEAIYFLTNALRDSLGNDEIGTCCECRGGYIN